jgi:D-glucosaminate-6-phosphate ammonia-lyase
MLRNLLRHAISRRDLFKRSGFAAAAGLAPAAALAAPGALEVGPRLYESIGVRPVINCRGTLTIIGGSQTLPEVKKAMDEASRHYVHIDELMEAVAQRLSVITGAEYGIITAGCAAALAHVTAACMAGSAPERMQMLPDTTGMKNEVLAPRYSRNEYDHAIRMVGAKIIDVANKEQFANAFTSRTAMVMVLAGPQDSGEFGLPFISGIAKQKGVPVIVDAAAEDLTIPNVHLQRGADIVCYSGGKVLRGPQCAGLALGRKDILQAAWINSAPHHAFGRAMKIGREEIMGMLAAVEAWTKRDMQAEYALKRNYLAYIADRMKSVPGVTSEILDTKQLSNHAPRLAVRWDRGAVPMSGRDVAMLLYEGSPRIDVGPSNRNQDFPANSITVGAHMMMPGDEKIVADRLSALLAKPPKRSDSEPVREPAGALQGRWDVRIEFTRGVADHILLLEQKGSQLAGTHFGEHVEGNIAGTMSGSAVTLRSSQRFEGTSLRYLFEGEMKGNQITGTVNLGEYGTARWTATKHQYPDPASGRRAG